MKTISIKFKLFVYLLGFCGLLLLLLWLFQVVFLDSFYKKIKITEVENTALAIEKNLTNDLLYSLIDDYAQSNDMSIELISETGVILYSTYSMRDLTIQRMPFQEKQKLLQQTESNNGELLLFYNPDTFTPDGTFDQNKFVPRERIPDREIFETILFTKNVSDENGVPYYIMINSLIRPVDATVNTLRIQLYYVTGFMILFSLLLSFFIAKKIAQPIEKINESAKVLSSGNYDVSFDGNGYKEISELSNTLNYASAELSKVDSLRKELIANVSHDLRTPLTLIGGYAEAMRDIPDENTSENAQVIIDETRRITTLVNDMLDISKFQSNMNVLNTCVFNLTETLRKSIGSLNMLLRKDGYIIDYTFEREVMVEGDESRISQAFYNLLINAVNYTGSDKRILVTQTLMDNAVKIAVSDTGEGIPDDELPYIWERYYRSDKNHKRAVTGSGLGLSIVKSIIDMHNGKYGVESVVGAGSTFWFELVLNKSLNDT
jgi:signal transduction histidine kinase